MNSYPKGKIARERRVTPGAADILTYRPCYPRFFYCRLRVILPPLRYFFALKLNLESLLVPVFIHILLYSGIC
jgi:hypothetical protein